jgi:hypothetical protein
MTGCVDGDRGQFEDASEPWRTGEETAALTGGVIGTISYVNVRLSAGGQAPDAAALPAVLGNVDIAAARTVQALVFQGDRPI